MLDRRLLDFPEARAALVLCCLLALCLAGASLAQALGLASALDLLRAGMPVRDAFVPLAVFALCFAALRMISALQDAIADGKGFAVAEGLRGSLGDALFLSAGRIAESVGAGGFASLAVEGCSQVHTYLRLVVPRMANLLFHMVPLIVAIAVLDWVSGLIVAAVLPVIAFYLALLGKQARSAASAQLSRGSHLASHFLDSVFGLPTLVAFGRDGDWVDSVRDASERFRAATMGTLKVATLSGAVLDLACTLAGAAVAVMLGFRLVDGSISFETAFAVLLLVPEGLAPLRGFASDFHATLDGRESLTRVLDMLAHAGRCQGDESGSAADGATACGHAAGKGADALREGAETLLEARGVGVSAGNADILSGVCFSLSAGAKVALIGRSGAGKSTLLRLLAGMDVPSAGVLGSPQGRCGDLRSRAWRSRVAFVPQHAAIVAASLRDNVALYNPDATDEQVLDALRRVGLGEFALSLPEGLDTAVGRGGRALSGGQAQRVALARALADPGRDVLLLDEPTAALDPWTERELAGALLAAMEGRTVVMATHRLGWLEAMDQVVVLDGGRVAACGSPAAVADAVRSLDVCEDAGVTAVERLRLSRSEGARAEGGRPPEALADAASPPISRKDRWVLPYLGRYRKTMAAALGLGVAAQAFAMGLMFTSGYLVSASALVASIIILHVPLAFVQLFGVGKPVLGYAERLASHDWVLQATSSLRTRLFEAYRALCRKGAGSFDAAASEAMGLLGEDVGHIQNLYLRCAFPAAIAWASCLVALAAVGVASAPFALFVAVVLLVASVAVPLWSAAANGPRIQRQRAVRQRLYALTVDDVAAAADWLLSGRRDDFLERQSALGRRERELQVRRRRFDHGRDIMLSSLFALTISATCLWGAQAFASQGPFEASWMCAFAIGLMPLFEVVFPLGIAAEEAGSHRDALERLNRLDEGAHAQAGSASISEGDASATGPEALCFADVAFDYGAAGSSAETVPLMSGFRLSVPAGQKVAVLGRSGVGKSTFAALAAGRLRPQEGEVRLFGRPTSRLSEEELSALVTYVQQDSYVFNLTLRENLLIGNAGADDDELRAALRAVGLSELLAGLPAGLDTPLLEGGSRLSGGERVRVCLARAYLRRSPVVLLDEPFASLDGRTRRLVMGTLMEAFSDRTVVVITHDERDLRLFDRVLLFET